MLAVSFASQLLRLLICMPIEINSEPRKSSELSLEIGLPFWMSEYSLKKVNYKPPYGQLFTFQLEDLNILKRIIPNQQLQGIESPSPLFKLAPGQVTADCWAWKPPLIKRTSLCFPSRPCPMSAFWLPCFSSFMPSSGCRWAGASGPGGGLLLLRLSLTRQPEYAGLRMRWTISCLKRLSWGLVIQGGLLRGLHLRLSDCGADS